MKFLKLRTGKLVDGFKGIVKAASNSSTIIRFFGLLFYVQLVIMSILTVKGLFAGADVEFWGGILDAATDLIIIGLVANHLQTTDERIKSLEEKNK